MRTGRRRRLWLLLALTGLLGPEAASATVTGYTSRAGFDAAVAALGGEQVLDFDSLAAGTAIPSGTKLGGISFSYSIAGLDVLVIDSFTTTSGSNSLGLTGGDDAFLSGDAFTLGLSPPVRAVGLYMIGANQLVGDFELHFAGAVLPNSATPDVVLSDGEAYFLGLVSDGANGFTGAAVVSVDPGNGDFFFWNADDIATAPEPAAGALGVAAAASLAAWRRLRGQAGRRAAVFRRARSTRVESASAPSDSAAGSGSTSERSSA